MKEIFIKQLASFVRFNTQLTICCYYKKKLSNDSYSSPIYSSINRLDQLKKNFAHHLRTLFLLFSNPCMFRVSVSTREGEGTSVTNTPISIGCEGTQIYGGIPIFPVCRDTQLYGIPIISVTPAQNSPAQPDSLPEQLRWEWVRGHGHTKFVLPHIYCGGQLPLANYREQPSSTTNSIGSNCPGMSRTVLDLLTLSCVLDSPAICPGCRS